jgi:hypothetical protein
VLWQDEPDGEFRDLGQRVLVAEPHLGRPAPPARAAQTVRDRAAAAATGP